MKKKNVIQFLITSLLLSSGCNLFSEKNLYASEIAKYETNFNTNYKTLHGFSENLIPIEDKNGIGFINTKGNIIASPSWESVMPFKNERAIVSKNGKYGLINNLGKIIVSPQYTFMEDCENRLFIVAKDKQFGLIDTDGKMVLNLNYQWISTFTDDMAMVKKGGKYGFIDKTGKLTIPIEWDCLGVFENGLAPAVNINKNLCGFIDKNGIVVTKVEDYYFDDLSKKNKITYSQLFMPSEGVAIYKTVEGDNGYIGIDGKIISPPQKNTLSSFVNGIGVIQKSNSTSTMINKRGKVIAEIDGYIQNSFSCNMGFAEKNKRYAAVNTEGKLVTGYVFTDFKDCSENLAAVKTEKGKWGFINSEGKLVIADKWDYVTQFNNGTAIAETSKEGIIKYAIIDTDGKLVGNKTWDFVGKYEYGENSNKFILVNENKKFGLLDNAGNILIPPQWDGISSGYVYGKFLLQEKDAYYAISIAN